MTNSNKLADALRKTYEAMELQEKREVGEFHIPQPSAKAIWDDAKETARKALAEHDAQPAPAPVQPLTFEQLADAEEDAYVIDKLAKLLARIAIALKGPQEPLHLHSYHDLPELVEKLVASAHPPALAADGAGEFPPLPKTVGTLEGENGYFTGGQMHAYALAAIAALRQPVPDAVRELIVAAREVLRIGVPISAGEFVAYHAANARLDAALASQQESLND